MDYDNDDDNDDGDDDDDDDNDMIRGSLQLLLQKCTLELRSITKCRLSRYHHFHRVIVI